MRRSAYVRFRAHIPAVFETSLVAQPVMSTAQVTVSEHLATLAACLNDLILTGAADWLVERPQLAVAVRLFSEIGFAGGDIARFVVLFSALEVLVPASGGTKRNRVVKMVVDLFRGNGRLDAKAIGKQLHSLYDERNSLLHEAKPVAATQIEELQKIVRDTLQILIRATETS